MITGAVNADREATVRLTIRGSEEREQGIEAVVDTGFNGFITLPPAVIALLGLSYIGRRRAILANGSEDLFDLHEATVVWGDQARAVEAEAADTDALVGTALLYGHDLRIHIVEGGVVTIVQREQER